MSFHFLRVLLQESQSSKLGNSACAVGEYKWSFEVQTQHKFGIVL